MKSSIHLSIISLKKINKIVQEFSLGSFKLEYDNSSGIGCVLNLKFDKEMNGYLVNVSVPIIGVEDW